MLPLPGFKIPNTPSGRIIRHSSDWSCDIAVSRLNLFIEVTGHLLSKPAVNKTLLHMKQQFTLYCLAQFWFWKCVCLCVCVCLCALPFDETHGTCCPVPLNEQLRVEQHAAPAIWICSLILQGQHRCLSHNALSAVTVVCSFLSLSLPSLLHSRVHGLASCVLLTLPPSMYPHSVPWNTIFTFSPAFWFT